MTDDPILSEPRQPFLHWPRLAVAAIVFLSFHVARPGIAGSDHQLVYASFTWGRPPAPPLAWRPYRNLPQQQLEADLSEPLTTLYVWAQQKTEEAVTQHDLAALVDQYTVLLGVIIQGTMWRKDSPYGHFSDHSFAITKTPWWNDACRQAQARVRKARGTPQYKPARCPREGNRHSKEKALQAVRGDERAQVQLECLLPACPPQDY